MSIFRKIKNFFSSLFSKNIENSITVKSVKVEKPFNFEKKEGEDEYTFLTDSLVTIKGYRILKGESKKRNFSMAITFKAGFKTDGASSPELAQKYVPAISPNNDIYNAAPFIHDGLYGLEGCINGADLTRDECDDILRGIWRISGMDRALAGVADFGIHFLAGSDDHWGSDTGNCRDYFCAEFKPE